VNRAFTILRTAREARHLTLTDIADATLINIEHLRAIDEGREGSLPEAYMRAFMREYASLVGVDPQELMQIFDDQRRTAHRNVTTILFLRLRRRSARLISPGGFWTRDSTPARL
jgi:cytoskeletal protein RodZ